MTGKIELGYTLEEMKKIVKSGPNRVMVRIIPNKPESALLEMPKAYQEITDAEVRACEVLGVGAAIKLELATGDIAMIVYRPTQKLWDTILTKDGFKVAFLPEEMFIGAVWTTSSK